VARRDLAGASLEDTSVTATVPPGATVTLPLELGRPADPTAELLVADAGGERAWWFHAEDKDITWPPAKYDTRIDRTATETRVTVTAHNLLRDLTLHPDRLHPDAEVDQAGVTVLPGESVTFTVTGVLGLEPAALTARPVLRCVNDLS
jgi:beta-mannosidase